MDPGKLPPPPMPPPARLTGEVPDALAPDLVDKLDLDEEGGLDIGPALDGLTEPGAQAISIDAPDLSDEPVQVPAKTKASTQGLSNLFDEMVGKGFRAPPRASKGVDPTSAFDMPSDTELLDADNSGQGDPFAGVDRTSAENKPTVKANLNDPFAGIDTSDTPQAPDIMGASSDPFAGIDTTQPERPPAASPINKASDPVANNISKPPEDSLFGSMDDIPAAQNDDTFGSMGEGSMDEGSLDAIPASQHRDPFASLDEQESPKAAQQTPPAGGPFASLGEPESPKAAQQTPPAGGPFASLGEPEPTPDPFASIDKPEPTADPFASIDKPEPPKAAQQTPPAEGEEASKDAFGNIVFGGGDAGGDDPFGALELDTSAEAPADKPAEIPTAPSAAPFASLDTQGSPAAEQEAQPPAGDPFAALNQSQGEGAPASAMPTSGYGMGADGQISGEAPPAPPGTTRALGPSSTPDVVDAALAAAAKAPPSQPLVPEKIQLPPPKGVMLAYKIGFGVMILVIAFFAFIVMRTGGKLDLTDPATYTEAFTGEQASEMVIGDLKATDLSNTSYSNRHGHTMVLLWGRIVNHGTEAKKGLAVTGQVIDTQNQVVAEMTVPAGVQFDPFQIFAITDIGALGMAYRDAYAQLKDHKLSPGAEMPFMVVLFEHPDQTSPRHRRGKKGSTDRSTQGGRARTDPARAQSGDMNKPETSKNWSKLIRRLEVLPEAIMRREVLIEQFQNFSTDEILDFFRAVAAGSNRRSSAHILAFEALCLVAWATDSNERLYEQMADVYGLAREQGEESIVQILISARPQRGPMKAEQVPGDQQLSRLTLGQRKFLARGHNRHQLERLLLDPEPSVVRNLLKNPSVVEADVVRLAARRPVRDTVLREIAASRWGQRYSVRLSLVLNPYTPPDLALKLVGLLLYKDLRMASKDGTLHPMVQNQAAQLLALRRPSKAPRAQEAEEQET